MYSINESGSRGVRAAFGYPAMLELSAMLRTMTKSKHNSQTRMKTPKDSLRMILACKKCFKTYSDSLAGQLTVAG